MQNPNGFCSLSMTKGTKCLDVMKELDLDMFALPETNRNRDDMSK